MWGRDLARTFSTPCPGLAPGNATDLRRIWFFNTHDVVTATPAVVDGTVYVGDWSGRFYAIDARSGEQRWVSQDQAAPQRVRRADRVVGGGRTRRRRTRTVYFGGGKTLYALRAVRRERPLEARAAPQRRRRPTRPRSRAHPRRRRPRDRRMGRAQQPAGRARRRPRARRGAPAGSGGARCSRRPRARAPRVRAAPTSGPRPPSTRSAASCSSARATASRARRATAASPRRSSRSTSTTARCGGRTSRTSPTVTTSTSPARRTSSSRTAARSSGSAARTARTTRSTARPARSSGRHPSSGPASRTRAATSRPGGFIGPTAVADGIITGGTAIGGSPYLHALDAATGAIRWQQPIAAPTYGAPALGGGVVIIGGTDFTLRALDLTTGQVLWSDEVSGAVSGGPAIVGDDVFAVAGHPRARAREALAHERRVPLLVARQARHEHDDDARGAVSGHDRRRPHRRRRSRASTLRATSRFNLVQPPPGTSPRHAALASRSTRGTSTSRPTGSVTPPRGSAPAACRAAAGRDALRRVHLGARRQPPGRSALRARRRGHLLDRRRSREPGATYNRITVLAITDSDELPSPAEGREPARRHEVVRPTARAGRPAGQGEADEQARAPSACPVLAALATAADAGVASAQRRAADRAKARRCIVLNGQGNDLDAYASNPPFKHQTVITTRAKDPKGFDINAQICFFPDGRTFIAGEDTGQPDPIQGWGIFKLSREHGRHAEGEADREAPADVPGRDRQRRELRLRRALRRAGRHDRHRQPVGGRRRRPAHRLVPAVHEGLQDTEERHRGQGAVLQDRRRHRDRGRHRGRRRRQPLRRVGAAADRRACGSTPVRSRRHPTPKGGCGKHGRHRRAARRHRAEGAVHRRRRPPAREPERDRRDGRTAAAGTCRACSPASSTSTRPTARSSAPCSQPPPGEGPGPKPISTGSPLGLGRGARRHPLLRRHRARDLRGRASARATARARCARSASSAASPRPPETMATGLAFPDGIGIFVPPKKG